MLSRRAKRSPDQRLCKRCDREHAGLSLDEFRGVGRWGLPAQIAVGPATITLRSPFVQCVACLLLVFLREFNGIN